MGRCFALWVLSLSVVSSSGCSFGGGSGEWWKDGVREVPATRVELQGDETLPLNLKVSFNGARGVARNPHEQAYAAGGLVKTTAEYQYTTASAAGTVEDLAKRLFVPVPGSRPLDGSFEVAVKSALVDADKRSVEVALEAQIRLLSGKVLYKGTFTQSSRIEEQEKWPPESKLLWLPVEHRTEERKGVVHLTRTFLDGGNALSRAIGGALQQLANELRSRETLSLASDPQLLVEAMARRGSESAPPTAPTAGATPPPIARAEPMRRHPPGFAQVTPAARDAGERERRVAVLVCSNLYTNHPNWNVGFIARNCDLLRETLQKHAGFDDVIVISGEDSERATVENALANVVPSALSGRRNLFLFYYTGHGYVDAQGRALFLTKNTLLKGGELTNVYGYADVGGWLAALRGRVERDGRKLQTLLVVDACRPAVLAPPAAAKITPVADWELQSCADNQLSEADPGRAESLFTRSLCDAIDAQAATGRAELEAVFARAKQRTEEVSKGAQTPVLRAHAGPLSIVDQAIDQLEVEVRDVDSGEPVADVALTVDGRTCARAPYVFNAVRAGDTELAIVHDRYGRLSRSLRLDKETRRLTVAISALGADEQVYVRAADADEPSAYSQYLERYPNGRSVAKAIARFREKIVEAPITGRVVFPAGDYHFDTDLVVSPEGTLVALSGARFLFKDKRRLVVHGRIEVNGTRDRPVVFRPQGGGSWWGIELQRAKGAWFEHAEVVGSNGVGIEVDGSALLMVSCKLTGNSGEPAGAIRAGASSSLRLVNCGVFDNSARRRGGAVFAEGSYLELQSCLLARNTPSDYGGRGGVCVVDGELEIRRTYFGENRCALEATGTTGLVQDCQFVKNEGDTSAIELEESAVRVQNCNFEGNGGKQVVLVGGAEGDDARRRRRAQGRPEARAGGVTSILLQNVFKGGNQSSGLAVTGGANVVVEGNHFAGLARGIAVVNASPRVARNVVTACGVGVSTTDDTAAQFELNVLANNSVGAELSASDHRAKKPTPVLTANLVQANGRGIEVRNADAEITHNVIRANGKNFASRGAGIAVRGGGTFVRSRIVANDIFENEVTTRKDEGGNVVAGLGGGLFLEEGVRTRVEGNFIHANSSDDTCGGVASNSQSVELVGNCIIDNKGPNRPNGFTGQKSLNDPAKLIVRAGLPEGAQPGLGGVSPGLSCDPSHVSVRGDIVISVGDEYLLLQRRSEARREAASAKPGEGR